MAKKIKTKIEEDLSESEILYRLLEKKVSATIDPHKVFHYKDVVNTAGQRVTTFNLGGKKLEGNIAMTLRSEAKLIRQSQLFKIFTETMRNAAHFSMFNGMKTIEDSHYGKAILYATDVWEQIVNKMAEMPEVQKTPTMRMSTPSRLKPSKEVL